MADEPSESVAQATQAHECNGAREGSSCSNLSESGAAINDGATEMRYRRSYSPICVRVLLHVGYVCVCGWCVITCCDATPVARATV